MEKITSDLKDNSFLLPLRERGAINLGLAVVLALGLSIFTDGLFAGELATLADRFAPAVTTNEIPNFQRHVTPLLGRLGCNGRNCHGSFQGQGGFRLSMFGYDFAADHAALTKGDKPRVDVKNPAASLILNKPTSEDDHGGGLRYPKDGWQYRVLRSWIEAGAKDDSSQTGKLVWFEITPAELIFDRVGQEVQLRAVAHWPDGKSEDVTCLTRFSSNDESVAEVSESGLVRATGKGDTYIISCYDNGVASTPALLPVSDQTGNKYPTVATPTKIDELVVAKLRKLGVVPSEVCGDDEFLRRASLDIAGTLPTPQEIAAFLADTAADKRDRKIDELLERPAYAIWWATRLCDVAGLNAPLFLGNTEFAKFSGDQWYTWVERRVRDNVPYDKIVEGIVLATSRQRGQSYDDFAFQQSQYTRKRDPIDFAAQDCMPFFWFRENINQPEEKALAFAYTFLGVRLECAQCHKHPFDQWSQQDFQQFAAIFDRVAKGIAPDAQASHEMLCEELGVPRTSGAAERRGMYIRLAMEGKPAPWREVYIAAPKSKGKKDSAMVPRLLGGREVPTGADDDPRVPLMQWLREKDNPYFASALVNRVWAHYLGKGIIDPPDDQNLGNPPSNKPLLNALEEGFIEHGYDLKWLHRTITRSHTYQRSWRPTATNRDDDRNFARAAIRRLPAEVAVDALAQATAGAKRLAEAHTAVVNRRIGIQPTADQVRTEYALAAFGKPLRLTNCDCEREPDPTLLQSIFLRNDKELHDQLDKRDGWLKELSSAADPDDLIREAYLRSLSRLPDEQELARSRRHLAETADRTQAVRDLLWALLNTQEFITNH